MVFHARFTSAAHLKNIFLRTCSSTHITCSSRTYCTVLTLPCIYSACCLCNAWYVHLKSHSSAQYCTVLHSSSMVLNPQCGCNILQPHTVVQCGHFLLNQSRCTRRARLCTHFSPSFLNQSRCKMSVCTCKSLEENGTLTNFLLCAEHWHGFHIKCHT